MIRLVLAAILGGAFGMAALVVPGNGPHESDIETIYHALGFGRAGYVEMLVAGDVERSEEIGQMLDSFLAALVFAPNRAYGDVQPADTRAPAGLAGAMGIDSLEKTRRTSNLWSADGIVPLAGGMVASIGGLALTA